MKDRKGELIMKYRREHGKSAWSNRENTRAIRHRELRRSMAKARLTTKKAREQGYTKLFKRRGDEKRSLFANIWRRFAI